MHLRYRLVLVAALFLLVSRPVHAQWLYVSESSYDCVVSMGANIAHGPSYVYLHAPDHDGATAVHFRLEIEQLGAEDEVLITPESGVSVTGDIRTGAVATFTPRELQYAPMFTIDFVDHEPFAEPYMSDYIFVRVRDAVLDAGGTSLPMEEMDIYHIHCFDGGGLNFCDPTAPYAQIGKTTMVAFQGISVGWYNGPGATNLVASDTNGWVASMSTNVLWTNSCGECPWFWETIYLTVTVPEGVAPGTTTTVTISEGSFSLKQFALTAIEPNGTQTRSWGAVKALYR